MALGKIEFDVEHVSIAACFVLPAFRTPDPGTRISDLGPWISDLGPQVSSESIRKRAMPSEAKLGLYFLQQGYDGQTLYEEMGGKGEWEQLYSQGNWKDAMESLLRYSLPRTFRSIIDW